MVRAVIIAVCLVFSATLANSQDDKFKCVYDDWANRFNNNSEWNSLLESACKDINASNYEAALTSLKKAIAIDSAANAGDVNVFIESQYRRLKDFIEFSLKEGAAGNNSTEGHDTKKQETVTDPQEQAVTDVPKSQTEPTKEEEKVSEIEKTADGDATKNAESKDISQDVNEQGSTADKSKASVETSDDKSSSISSNESTSVVNEATSVHQEVENPVVEETAVKPEEVPLANQEVEQPSKDLEQNESSTAETVESDNGKMTFSEEEKVEFQEKGMQKIKQLESYLIQIGSKSTPLSMSSQAMDNAVQLFDREDRTVQVSSVKNELKPKFKVKTYLQKIRNLNYDDVEIEWADFQYASDFYLGKDGNYYAYIVFSQRFTGTTDNKVMYQDITTKRTEIVLKFYEKASQGELKKMWDVFLGDISVLQTESF